MTSGNSLAAVLLCLVLALPGASAQAQSVRLQILAAGTLARPFRDIDRLFEKKYPNVAAQPQFGGSVKMAREITQLHEPADILAVADYNVIPQYLFPAYAGWYAGFARNAITFVYMPTSKYAREVTPADWYRVLGWPGVEIGRSNPDTDPSGYQTVQMLALAEKYYKAPGLAARILGNSPPANMRDTETSLIAALQLGQIDYLAIYRSDALQHDFRYLRLPAQIDLSDPRYAGTYKEAVAQTKNGALEGRPIVYAVTIPRSAPHPEWAQKYLALLLGAQGRAVMKRNGFGVLDPPYAVGEAAMPQALRALVKPWPGS
jgi:molybdate/tungstate transport system substrate-binding protein